MKMPKGDLATYAPNGQVKYLSTHSFVANSKGIYEEKTPCFIILNIMSYLHVGIMWQWLLSNKLIL